MNSKLKTLQPQLSPTTNWKFEIPAILRLVVLIHNVEILMEYPLALACQTTSEVRQIVDLNVS